jgi:hypothetical protein
MPLSRFLSLGERLLASYSFLGVICIRELLPPWCPRHGVLAPLLLMSLPPGHRRANKSDFRGQTSVEIRARSLC